MIRIDLLGLDSDLLELMREQAVLGFFVRDGTGQFGCMNAAGGRMLGG